ncbi:hypothetical protein Gohar_017504 [Gossypium harknessii]|uniref:Uncharacterized protein n=1 Tax=Gossypium harknessii TaxID=34285 RepID=A0A7J9G6I0_9ROSI|nr:hypothetical protein [Gossypium harknessii]
MVWEAKTNGRGKGIARDNKACVGEKPIVKSRSWDNICMLPKQPTIVPVILDFYSNLKNFEHNRVYVKYASVDISSLAIFKYYGVLRYEEDDLSSLF